jgi:hypothetical protein
MSGDALHKVSWKPGELLIHGSSEKYLRQVAVEWLLAEGRISVELVKQDSEKENHWPPKEVAPIKSRFNE